MSVDSLKDQGITPSGKVHFNLVPPELYDAAARRQEGEFADMGPFVAVTTPHTGRSPKDKFIVKEPSSEKDVDWGMVNQPMSERTSRRCSADVQAYLGKQPELFVQDLYCGADPDYRLSVRYVSPNAWHMAFVRNMFIRPERASLATFAPNFTVLHAPEMQADPARHGTRTGTFIAVNIGKRMILIGGTRYAGELKKSMFTVMNYMMPKQNVLSMHCSANVGKAGDTALFFGLSGTGKTTLSADPSRNLIGDDEHGWSSDGVFNFEGGCYAKVIHLSPETRTGHLPHDADVRDDSRERGARREQARQVRRPVDHREHACVVPDQLHPEHRRERARRPPEERRPAHRRRVRRAATHRAPHARAGAVLFPLGLHREARRHGARSEGAAGDVQRLLRRGVPRVARSEVRRDARASCSESTAPRCGSSTPAGAAARTASASA